MRAPALMLTLAMAALPGTPATAGTDGTLYGDLGGLPVITKVVETAGALFRADPRTRSYFDNINSAWLRPRLIAFVCHVTGGPCVYPGRTMAASHKGLHIDQPAFDAYMEDFQAAMRRIGVPLAAQTRLISLLVAMGRDIVTR